MVFIFSMPVLIRHLWQLKTVVFLHWRLICAALLSHDSVIITLWTSNNQHIIILQSTYDILTIISRSPYNHSMIIYTLWSSYNYLTVILELIILWSSDHHLSSLSRLDHLTVIICFSWDHITAQPSFNQLDIILWQSFDHLMISALM